MKISAEEEARRNRIREKLEKRRREQANDLVPSSMLPDNPSKSFPEGYLEERDKEERPKKPKGKSHKGYNKGGKIDGCAVRGKTRGRMC